MCNFSLFRKKNTINIVIAIFQWYIKLKARLNLDWGKNPRLKESRLAIEDDFRLKR